MGWSVFRSIVIGSDCATCERLFYGAHQTLSLSFCNIRYLNPSVSNISLLFLLLSRNRLVQRQLSRKLRRCIVRAAGSERKRAEKTKKGPTSFSESDVQPKSGLHRESPSSFLSLHPLQLTQIKSDPFEKHIIRSAVMWSTSTYPPCSPRPHPTAAVNPFLSLSSSHSFINFSVRYVRDPMWDLNLSKKGTKGNVFFPFFFQFLVPFSNFCTK